MLMISWRKDRKLESNYLTSNDNDILKRGDLIQTQLLEKFAIVEFKWNENAI